MGTYILVFILFTLFTNPSTAEETQCVLCHQNLGEEHQKIISDFGNDVHKQAGLSCHSCHGGDPKTDDITLAMNPAAGFTGKPGKAAIPNFCGKCHSNPAYMKKFNPALPTDQEEKYYTSMHGLRFKKGDTKAAVCINCHPAHNIRKSDDPMSSVYPKNVAKTCANCHGNVTIMAEYGIPTDQFERYMKSVHANALYKKSDLSAPTCNDCHGNHGAMPPGVNNIMMICGQCHAHNMEFFQQSPMFKTWEKSRLHMCVVCHKQHDVLEPNLDMLAGEMSVCLRCHTAEDKGYQAGASMKQLIENYKNRFHNTSNFIEELELNKGMDVTETEDNLQESRQTLFLAKTAVHGFNPDKVREIIDKGNGFLKKAEDIGVKLLREFWRRRIWAGLSTLTITLLIVGIYLKLKELEKNR